MALPLASGVALTQGELCSYVDKSRQTYLSSWSLRFNVIDEDREVSRGSFCKIRGGHRLLTITRRLKSFSVTTDIYFSLFFGRMLARSIGSSVVFLVSAWR